MPSKQAGILKSQKKEYYKKIGINEHVLLLCQSIEIFYSLLDMGHQRILDIAMAIDIEGHRIFKI